MRDCMDDSFVTWLPPEQSDNQFAETDTKDGTLSFSANNADIAVLTLDDTPGHGQTDAGAVLAGIWPR